MEQLINLIVKMKKNSTNESIYTIRKEDNVTVIELIKELQALVDEGKGEYDVIDGEYCMDVNIQWVDEKGKYIMI